MHAPPSRDAQGPWGPFMPPGMPGFPMPAGFPPMPAGFPGMMGMPMPYGGGGPQRGGAARGSGESAAVAAAGGKRFTKRDADRDTVWVHDMHDPSGAPKRPVGRGATAAASEGTVL